MGCGSGGQKWREGWARETRRPRPTHLSGHLVGEVRMASRFPGEAGDQEFKEASSERPDDFALFPPAKDSGRGCGKGAEGRGKGGAEIRALVEGGLHKEGQGVFEVEEQVWQSSGSMGGCSLGVGCGILWF